MQSFAVWIACLRLFLKYQHLGRESHRGGSASRTKGSADMSPGGRQSKRVKSTRPGELTHGVRTRSTANKMLDVSAESEHNSPPLATTIHRTEFHFHELTGDVGLDGTLHSPVRDWSRLDDDS